MGVGPLFTAGISASQGAAGAGAAGLGAALPWLAVPAAIGGGFAYAFSPTVRKYVNNQAKGFMTGLEGMGENALNGVTSLGQSGGFLSNMMGQNQNQNNQQNQTLGAGKPPMIPPHADGTLDPTNPAMNPGVYMQNPYQRQRGYYNGY